VLALLPAVLPMNPDAEIRRLLDVMPASGRMNTELLSKPDQPKVLDSPVPMPWSMRRKIWINFDRWGELNRSQRDLLILYQVSWLGEFRWLRPAPYQGLALAGLVGAGAEFFQGDALGVLMTGALGVLAGTQIWRDNRSTRREIEADEVALRVAQRRGYSESEAARSLISAIEAVVRIEGRSAMSFIELVRCQNLRAIAGLSPVGVPDTVRRES